MDQMLLITRYNQIKQQAMPKNKPFEKNPIALKLFLQLKDDFKEFLTSKDGEYLAIQSILAHIYHDIGCLYVNNGDITMAESYFKECLELFKTHDIQTKARSAYMGALFNIGAITDDRKKALYYLTDAEKAYKEHKESQEGANHKGITQEDRLYKEIMEQLAEVYNDLGIVNMTVKYNYMAMKWSFENKLYISCDLSAQSADIAFFYITRRNFKEARRYMAAANYFAEEFRNESNDGHHVEKVFADLGRQWAHYGLSLLTVSRKRLDGEEHELFSGMKHIALDNEMPFLFPKLPLAKYEKITADYCTTLNDAKEVFLFIKKWLEKSKEFYKPNVELKTFVNVTTDFAKLYNLMSSFEDQWHNQYDMQKMSFKYFDDFFGQLGPKTPIGIWRDVWYGTGQSYCLLIQLEGRMIDENVDTSFINRSESDQMAKRAILYFQLLINSFRGESSYWKPNTTFEEKKMCIDAHNKLALLYSIHADPDIPESITDAYTYLKEFIWHCNKDKEMKIAFKQDIDVAQKRIESINKVFFGR
ncbi:KIF-binding protein-like [Musca autumnalis]|uniref:KIF-binding protein-like n=1 Tax=Musca autumnalis TaxID=221902 RepID=UPI003CE8D252